MDDKNLILQQNKKIKELELQNKILTMQQEESPDGILVVDSNWNMVSYNRRFVNMWGIEQHILEAKDDRASLQSILDKLCHPKQFLAKVEYLMAHPTEKSQEILELKNGCFFDRSSRPVIDEDNQFQGRIWFFRDITQTLQQETERLQTARQQEQLKNLESLRTMAGAIAHRFNNAMLVVQGNLELMTYTLAAESKERKMASDAAQAANGAAQVGSMMLSYVGQQPLELQETSLETLVRESVSSSENLLNSTISLKLISPDQPLYSSVDQKQMQEVILSVLTNAIESLNNAPGEIEISFGSDVFSKDSLHVTFHNEQLKDGDYVYCQIKDTGHGMKPQNLSRIFEPFYTTRFIGRGLGLALATGIMQSHHGALTVESTPGQGTTVKVLLPAISPTQQLRHSEDFLKEELQLSGNILLVDDDEMVLDVGKQLLEVLGLTVYTTMDGKEAVEKVHRNDVDFSAVVLDISMPVMDGIEAMNAIRKINPSLPILLTSGYSEDEFPYKKGQGNEPDGFLSKPFRISDMHSCLNELWP